MAQASNIIITYDCLFYNSGRKEWFWNQIWLRKLRTNLIEISNENTDDGDDEDETVATNGVVVGAKALGEEEEAGVDLVLADSLEHPGGPDQGGNGRREGGCKAAGIDQRSPGGHVLKKVSLKSLKSSQYFLN